MAKTKGYRHFCHVNSGRDNRYLKEFGKNFRKIRNSKRISQESLALDAGLSKNHVGMIERGEVNLTINTLKKLAKHLGVLPKDLLDF